MSDRTPDETRPVPRVVRSVKTVRKARSTQHIDHSAGVAESIANLYGDERFSDLTLVVQGVHFKVHRVILAARSEYFRALLYGGLAESSRSVIQLNDISSAAFKHVLHYIYTGRLNVRRLKTMLDVLGLAHQYDFRSLESALSNHLTHSLWLSNVWMIYNLAVLYDLEELVNACLKFLDGIAPLPLHNSQFLHLSQAAVERLLSRDSFCATEIDIFRSLCAWFEANQDTASCISSSMPPGPAAAKSGSHSAGDKTVKLQGSHQTENVIEHPVRISLSEDPASSGKEDDSKSILSNELDWGLRSTEDKQHQMMRRCVRFELMSLTDLLTEVRSSKLVSPDDLLDAITRQAKSSSELPHRGWLLPGINLASPRFGCSLISGEEGSYPYFFVDDADNESDLAELQFSLNALECTEEGSLEDLEEDDESRSDSGSDMMRPTSPVNRNSPDTPVPHVPGVVEHGDLGSPRLRSSNRRQADMRQQVPNAAVRSPRFQQFQFGHSNWPNAQSNVGQSASRASELNQARIPDELQYVRINNQFCVLPPDSAASRDDLSAQRPGTARSMRWLTPSQRRRTIQHPPPPPHSEYDVVRHSLDDANAHIVVRLGKPSIVNTIRMQLWDREVRCYSYYVEVSLDQLTWYRVVDYRNYLCRSWQTLHFPARVIHYVRITGTRNTSNRTFHLITFRCLYSESVCQQIDGFLVPSYNVASVEHGATVLEGVSRNRNALIDGNARMYDWNSGYTCHQLGNGAIVVQLAQPFLIRSMRFLLWDLDDRTYSYSVHVSTNRDDWRLVHDATHDRCQSWQILTFPLQLVTFIRIIGSHNTANEVFHMVHLECPYPPAEQLDDREPPLNININPPSSGEVDQSESRNDGDHQNTNFPSVPDALGVNLPPQVLPVAELDNSITSTMAPTTELLYLTELEAQSDSHSATAGPLGENTQSGNALLPTANIPTTPIIRVTGPDLPVSNDTTGALGGNAVANEGSVFTFEESESPREVSASPSSRIASQQSQTTTAVTSYTSLPVTSMAPSRSDTV
ncbi:unnamed protein product [Calicophoron daubneyi]|uniref:BTB domain-containing protein n=1 Tax=Calicophoron daubneyi TaxID=300641 RepID=A0AAV2TXN6_CALDB